MTDPGELTRKVTFQQQALDSDNQRFGAWTDVVTRQAKIQPLIKGAGAGETVVAQRIQGDQPAIIFVRRDSLTKLIDNGYRAIDARNPTLIWNITSVIWNEREDMMEFMGVQRPGGSDV